jgi:hypothetical protein
MAAQKPLQIVSGKITQVEALQSSAGAGDAGKIVALDAAGRVHSSMMPVGIGADTASITASGSIAAGDLVNVFDSSGPKVRKADATTAGKEAIGFVLSAFSDAETALVYFEGNITGLSGLTPGTRYYLSSTAGQMTATPLTATGNVSQYVGMATSTTTLSFEPSDGIVMA